MSVTESRKARLHAALTRIAEPIAEEYREIEAELAEVEARRTELMEARREALHILRVADPDNPEWAPKQYANGKGKSKPKTRPMAAEETQDRVAEWLREHTDNGLLAEGIYAGGMMKHPDIGELGLSRATIQSALNSLAERGILRLDRIATPEGSRGSKAHIYKLTE